MKLKYGFIAFFAICALVFSSCNILDFLNDTINKEDEETEIDDAVAFPIELQREWNSVGGGGLTVTLEIDDLTLIYSATWFDLMAGKDVTAGYTFTLTSLESTDGDYELDLELTGTISSSNYHAMTNESTVTVKIRLQTLENGKAELIYTADIEDFFN